MGAIGVFTEEQQAYDLVMNLSWILPTLVVIGALLDAFFVTVYMEFAHPWKDIVANYATWMGAKCDPLPCCNIVIDFKYLDQLQCK